jgi:endonuclease YncB( thermonuclease family)
MQNRLSKLSSIFFAITMTTACTAPDTDNITGRASVIDGDTIEVRGTRIRLHGIDAPESEQSCLVGKETYRCGQQSALHLDTLIGGNSVSCNIKDIDVYGRKVAECFARNVNINERMVTDGWAIAYRTYSKAYVSHEMDAQQNKRGMWAGAFENPQDFRRQPTEQELLDSKGCLIKGNINSQGEKIYHLPGGRYYGQTTIETSKGEKWFCKESDAKNAGWVPSRN